ncbi:MAG: hypothetical protein KAI79_01000 [Bacteroidales bacterium]|nr:hypothetical protein [Bacteroidales bacterium]
MNKNIQNKASRILEIIWLIIAGLSLLIVIQNIVYQNWENTLLFSAFILVALFMHFLRRNNRIKEENEN